MLCPISAAVKIQRTWRRQENLASLAKKLDGDFFNKMKEDNFMLADPAFMIEQSIYDTFKMWMGKLLSRGGSHSSRLELLNRSSEITFCWFVAVFRELWDQSAGNLVDFADRVVGNFLDCHDGNYGDIRILEGDIRAFLDELMLWRRSEELQPFMRRLRAKVIQTLQRAVRPRVCSDILFQFRRLVSLYGLVDNPNAMALESSPVYRAIRLANQNEFWMTTLSHARILHELILDRQFTVHFSQCLPHLSTKHSDPTTGRILDSQGFRDDVMSCLLSAVDDGQEIELIADTFHANRDSSSRVFADAVFGIIQVITGNSGTAQVVRAEWDERGQSQPLEAVVFCVRRMRHALENVAVDFVRQSMNLIIRENSISPEALRLLQVRQKERTGRWIASSLATCSRDLIIALVQGNSFALLEFFDRSMLRLVLEHQPEVDFLSEELCPEFLRFDRSRLIDIRLDLSACSLQFTHFSELVTAGRWMGPPNACTATVSQSAERVNTLLRFHRYCHGQMLCSHIMESAVGLMLNEAMHT